MIFMVSPLEHDAMTGVDPMLPQPFRIRRRRSETLDTFTLEIERAKHNQAFGFAPGQFNMLYVLGVGEIPISICGDPRSNSLMHTTRVVGPVTMAMSKLRRGDILGVRGPFGSSWPTEQLDGCDVVVVAGGIGLAPLRGALHQLVRRRKKLGKLVFLYGARTPGDANLNSGSREDCKSRLQSIERHCHGLGTWALSPRSFNARRLIRVTRSR